MDTDRIKKQFGELNRDMDISNVLDTLKKSQECLQRISNIETKIMNIEKDSKGEELNDPSETSEETIKKLTETKDDFVIEVGKFVSVYGIKYLIVSNYPKSFKLKKYEQKRHVVPIKKGDIINIMETNYVVFKAEPQFITFMK